ncbi:MAG TPA: DUF4157 domain-containing protein, partial [Bacteroidetes bacterium]|nr:DUF4157 domain-containing protein [Bacteroidota bacterium]
MKAHLPKTRLPKEAPDHKQQNALSLPEIAQGNATGNSLLPPQFSLTASPTHQGKVETASEAEPDLIEHEQQGGIHANSLETPVDPPSENPKNGNGLPNDLQAVINQGLGGDFSSVEIIQNAPLPQSLGADALAQGNQIHFAPGKFDPNSPAGKELIGHEFKHIDQQRKGLVAATSQAKGLPANEDENLEKEADNFGQKVAQGSPGPDTQAEAETSTLSPASSGIAQMRLPTHASLVAMLADPNLGLSEAVIRDRVGTALSRMAEENKLITHDSVPVILGRIFPGGGVINEAAFNAVVDVTNRSRVYQNVMDTGNPIHDADKTRFIRLVERAVQVCRVSQSMDTSLERIFGTETPAAKTIYQAAGDFLENMIASNAMLDNTVTTD